VPSNSFIFYTLHYSTVFPLFIIGTYSTGAKVPTLELSFPRTKVPKNESSIIHSGDTFLYWMY